ncbi:hypothetical protein PoB_004329000 [Plakobranchus ocellatus]|uniref:Uncharacterized protein n=1 Tax=Plakobranchus ocellatus TaxID=259542 RepID=A0AAV4BCH7_9GAST|nr:hypothetical protein PoB_004329000 [Plakobranchus ocellatus]
MRSKELESPASMTLIRMSACVAALTQPSLLGESHSGRGLLDDRQITSDQEDFYAAARHIREVADNTINFTLFSGCSRAVTVV